MSTGVGGGHSPGGGFGVGIGFASGFAGCAIACIAGVGIGDGAAVTLVGACGAFVLEAGQFLFRTGAAKADTVGGGGRFPGRAVMAFSFLAGDFPEAG